MKKHARRIILATTACLGFCYASAEGQPAPSESATGDMYRFTYLLSSHLRCSVSFEDRRPLATEREHSVLSGKQYVFDARAIDGNITNVIRLLESVNPGHELRWNMCPQTGTLNLYPATNGWCDWRLEHAIDITASVMAILHEFDTLGLKEHGIYFSPGRGSWSFLEKTVHLKLAAGASAREAMNQLCSIFPPGVYWMCTTIGSGKGAQGMLTLRRYNPQPDKLTTRLLDKQWDPWWRSDPLPFIPSNSSARLHVDAEEKPASGEQ